MSGRQSSSMALLDETGTGVVLSSILHREQARMYVKGVRDGAAEFELSPEEDEAIRTALGEPVAEPQLVKVAFLGPEGTFSEEALLASAGRDEIEPVPLATIYECVMAVQEGRADRALVPIENSLEGSVNATLDALVFETDGVQIVGEVVHPIQHCLIARDAARAGRDPARASRTHRPAPNAPGSCASGCRAPRWCAPTAPPTRCASWPAATSPGRRSGPRLSAELYGCEVLLERRGGHSRERDSLRLAGADGPRAAERAPIRRETGFQDVDRLLGPARRPGSLVRVLQEFADRGVNLSRIESRPRKQGLGRYIFFADLEGHAPRTIVVAALGGGRAIGRNAAGARLLPELP